MWCSIQFWTVSSENSTLNFCILLTVNTHIMNAHICAQNIKCLVQTYAIGNTPFILGPALHFTVWKSVYELNVDQLSSIE